MENCIRVTGTGLLRLKPDLCRVTLTLRGLEPAYADALTRASRDSAALGEAIAALDPAIAQVVSCIRVENGEA